MIKKILLILLFVSTNFLFANTKDNIDGLLNKTNSLALGHIALIEDRSIISTSYTSIINYGYLDSNFTSDNFFGGNVSYTSNNTSIDINTNILSSNLTIDEKEYFLANYKSAINGRTIYEKNGYIYVMYFYSKKAISNILNNNSQNEYIGDAVPTSFTTPTLNQRWWDSNDVSFNVKQYVNGSFTNEDYTNQNLLYNGSFSNLNTIPLVKSSWDFTKVTATEKTHDVICDTGANYNQIAQRCEAYTSNACDGNSFDDITKKCYKKPIDYCKSMGYSSYDNANNRCVRGAYIYFPTGTSTNTTSGYPNPIYRNGYPSGALAYGQNWGAFSLGHSGGGCNNAGAFNISVRYYNDSNILITYSLFADGSWSHRQRTVTKETDFYDEYYYRRDVGRFRIDMRTGYVYSGYCKGGTSFSLVARLDGFPKKMTCGGKIFETNDTISEGLYYASSSGLNSFITKNSNSSYTLDYILSAVWETKSQKVTVSADYWDKLYGTDSKGTIETKFYFDYDDKIFWIGDNSVGGTYKQTPLSLKSIQCFFITNYATCPSGSVQISSSQCREGTEEYLSVPSSYGSGYTFSNNSIGGADAYIKNTNCVGRNMSVYPYYPTPHNGNNGLCYSDVGLYCKNTGGLSYDGIYTCYKENQRCNTTEYMIAYNYSGTNDKCTKQDYSCSVGALYGLATHPSNSNTTDLFNRIASKETKAETNATQLLLGNDVIVNDNQGSMCVGFKTTTFTQDLISPDYTINSIQKSGF